MIDEPVQKRSARSMKPTRGLIHSTSSSEKRDTCVMIKRSRRCKFDGEIAIRYGVERVCADAIEAEALLATA